MFEDGLAAAKRGDYATALKFWRPLAEQGDAKAQNKLGFIYANGRGVPPDDTEAVKWWRLAAEQGHAEAAELYRRAAEQGDAKAQFILGIFYGIGRGIPQDYVSARMWFTLAAAQGHENAHKAHDIVAKRMTPDQIAEAQRMAREWTAKHQQ